MIPKQVIQRFYSICGALLLSTPAIAQEVGSAGSVPDGLSSGDWSSIRGAYDAGRHQVVPDGAAGTGHFQAHNPGQGWDTYFDGCGFTTQPSSGGWAWGLQLQSFGFEGYEQEVTGDASPCADGGRLEYMWTDTLDEWYVNDTRGLEHGYTLTERPSGGEGPLTFTIGVRGGLRTSVSDCGTSVAFIDARGSVVVTYAGLKVFDDEGIAQQARFTGFGDRFNIVIDEAGAKYPLTIDPIAQQAYLKASNTEAGDRFGSSIAISGDWMVIGAGREDSAATGVNGNQSSNGSRLSGAAYVFERSGGVWSQHAYLKASNTEVNDFFGFSVGISGNRIVVGAPSEASAAIGINGNQNNNGALESGAAYVFERIGGVWSQQAYLKASNTEAGDFFGGAVAISGDLVVVSARAEGSNATGINGNQNDNSAGGAGAVYIFEGSGGAWNQQAYLKASNTDAADKFGFSVDISGELVVVGAPFESSSETGVNGNQFSNDSYAAGAAYVFVRTGGAWFQQAYLKASNAESGDHFGYSVATSGERIVAGASQEASDATGVNGDQSSNVAALSGAAYVFERSAGVWSQEAYLKASNTGSVDLFGKSVAISGDMIISGAVWEDSNSSGVNGGQNNDGAIDSGAAYAFERTAGAWIQQAYLKASNADVNDGFGTAVEISGSQAVVGAWSEDSNATGLNGDQNANSASGAGAVYAFNLSAPIGSYCGSAVGNSSGFSAVMSMTGSRVVASNDFSLHATGLPVGQFGYFLNSMGRAYVANPGGSQGNLCLGGGASIGRHHASLQNSGATGTMDFTLDLTDVPTSTGSTAIQAGETWNFQCWFRDQNPGNTSNFSDGLSVLFE